MSGDFQPIQLTPCQRRRMAKINIIASRLRDQLEAAMQEAEEMIGDQDTAIDIVWMGNDIDAAIEAANARRE